MSRIKTNLINHHEQNNFSYSLKTIVVNNHNILCINAAVLFSLIKLDNGINRLLSPEQLESVIGNNFNSDTSWDIGIPKGTSEFLASGIAYSPKAVPEVEVSIRVGNIAKQLTVAKTNTPGISRFEQPVFVGAIPKLPDGIDINQTSVVIPENTMPENFNFAPVDQRFSQFFQGNEEIQIKNMHQLLPEINSALPGIRPRFFVVQETEENTDVFREMVVQNDTLWLLPNVECGILIYRATCPSANAEATDIKCIYSVIENMSNEPQTAEYYMQQMLSSVQAQETISSNTTQNTAASEIENNNLTQESSVQEHTENLKIDGINEEKIILDVIDKIQGGNNNLSEAEKQYKPIFDQLNQLMTQFKLTKDGVKDFLEERKTSGQSIYPSEEEIIENFREVWEKDPELEKNLREKMAAFKQVRLSQLEQLRNRTAS